MEDIIVPIAVIGLMTLILLAFIRFLETWVLGRTIKAALQHHPESVALLTDKIGKRHERTDSMTGLLWIVFAVALLAYAALLGGKEGAQLAKVASVPAIMGAGFVLIHRFRRSAG